MYMNQDALKMISEGARKLAGEQIASGKRKGIGMDGSEITITISAEKPEDEKCGMEEEPMIKKKMKEYGIEV